jgi:hypothetical protein
MFYYTCFNVEDPDDPSVGLINGELALPGNLLRREVFEPVVDQVCPLHLQLPILPMSILSLQVIDLIEDQCKKIGQGLDALLLVGDFSGSEYLYKRVEVN